MLPWLGSLLQQPRASLPSRAVPCCVLCRFIKNNLLLELTSSKAMSAFAWLLKRHSFMSYALYMAGQCSAAGSEERGVPGQQSHSTVLHYGIAGDCWYLHCQHTLMLLLSCCQGLMVSVATTCYLVSIPSQVQATGPSRFSLAVHGLHLLCRETDRPVLTFLCAAWLQALSCLC